MKMNLARRAAMKALIGSPIAARGIVEAAAAQALGETGSIKGVPESGQSEPSSEVICGDPLYELFERHARNQRKAMQLRRAKNADHAMSESIRSKKSWSGAFKNHLAQKELRNEMEWDDYSDEGRIRALVNAGILPKSLIE